MVPGILEKLLRYSLYTGSYVLVLWMLGPVLTQTFPLRIDLIKLWMCDYCKMYIIKVFREFALHHDIAHAHYCFG